MRYGRPSTPACPAGIRRTMRPDAKHNIPGSVWLIDCAREDGHDGPHVTAAGKQWHNQHKDATR